ncbi:uncharacterized protein J4E92_007520 [Alternaria infectoria]|uniref:uncharacterized protein n=1 Tax=Alternaria infectoria TaxID=45303 RepID=UPI00221F0F6D|nr:uncharacterized protein J4E92_007520 [Alternaria infectoria]KAI4924439.1 hypothetical protein J4E92_007520 [Alternaria infectoria]
MEPHESESSADDRGDHAVNASDLLRVDGVLTEYARHTGNTESKPTDETTELGLQLSTKKRSHEYTPDEDGKRVRTKTHSAPQSPTTPDDQPTPPSTPLVGSAPDIMQIMTNFTAVTGQIVASIKDKSLINNESTRNTVKDMLREVLKMLVPCVTEIREMGALGIEIVGLATLLDSSLGREGIFTIICSPYSSSIPKPLHVDFTDYFAVGDAFWDRVVEFSLDPTLKPGEKAAPSSQGLVCAAWRLHIVAKVTPRNIWTTVCRLSNGKGVSNLHENDRWMQMHLHDDILGPLPRNRRAEKNGTPHESLICRRVSSYRDRAINANAHFSAMDAVPHSPSEGMVPVGSLDKDSRDLFVGLKANAYSPDGKLIAHPKGMDKDAVERGLRMANRGPRDPMPRPGNAQHRDMLFGQLRTHPSKGESKSLLRESSTFSSAYSVVDSQGKGAQSSIDDSRDHSSSEVSPSQGISQTLFRPTSHAQQQAPVQATDGMRADQSSRGGEADTTATSQRNAPAHANTKPKASPFINRPAMAQNLHQTHDGAMVNPILNVTEQNQSLNINQPVSNSSFSPERKGGDGGF